MTKAKYPYIARGNQRYEIARTDVYNVDNGAGATIDFPLFSGLSSDVIIVAVRAVYTEATDTAGAARANFKLGTTAGGTDIVGATALEVSKAVGAYTTATIVAEVIAAGSTLFCRHTGVASTEVGQYYVQVTYMRKP